MIFQPRFPNPKILHVGSHGWVNWGNMMGKCKREEYLLLNE